MSQTRILLVEDEIAIAETIEHILRDLAEVTSVTTVTQATEYIDKDKYDVYIVDIILKSESGLEICKYIREFDIHTPVLIITGKTELLTKLRAFECGADDYLCKPFDLLELKARVKALLKRTSNGHPNDVLKVADLEVHTSKRMAMRKGKQLSLRRKEFDILEYLARNAGLLISREQIIQNIWEDTTDIHSNSVDVHVKNLRQQMDKPFKRKLLKTVYGLGYKLEDVV